MMGIAEEEDSTEVIEDSGNPYLQTKDYKHQKQLLKKLVKIFKNRKLSAT
jgi:hypothetical protein